MFKCKDCGKVTECVNCVTPNCIKPEDLKEKERYEKKLEEQERYEREVGCPMCGNVHCFCP